MDLAMLQEDLQEKLKRIKFFVVLDDVGNDNYDDEWHTLCSPLKFWLPGSNIILTAHNHVVESVVSFQKNSHLQEVGQGLVRKCEGIPLAAKVVGGILHSKYSESEWKDVLDSKIWGLPHEINILPVLRLSYHHLPSHLRNPFAYCSVLPKDYDFDQNDLVLLWMGEGFSMFQINKEERRLGSCILSTSCYQDPFSKEKVAGIQNL